MALQIWLPLNKDYSNKGLNNDVSATGTMVFSSTGSPTNGCYKFSATQNITISGVNFGNLKKASISLWVWEDSLVNTVFFTGPSTSHYVIAANTNGTSNIYHSANVGGAKTIYVDGVASTKLGAAGAWHHYVITDVNLSAWTGTTLKFNNYNTSYNFAGRVRDIRIYDVVLTEKDVKELYWSKVFEFTPQWRDATRVHDASGFNFPLTPSNIAVTGNTALFNGSSSKIEFDGLKITGGTVSVWFSVPAKPTVQRVLYFDPVSRMTVGFLTDGNLLVRTTSGARYLTTGITWGQLTHVVVGYNASYVPQYCLINGVQPGTGNNSNWSYTGSKAAIGARIGGNADWFSGSVNEVKVFSTMLTQAEAKTLYDIGPNPNVWGEIYPNIDLPNWSGMYLEYRDCLWVKVLHHNRPASNIFTTANAKNINTENLFSKLYLFDDTTRFKSTAGKYEFMVREKLESTSTENIGIWSQTSSPTANAIAGYTQIYTSTGSWPRSFGLTHQSANAVFDDSGSSTWWCSCGCNTAYQGGIPSFWGICKTGYLDLYIRVDNTPFFNKPL